jgi:hypothetical protein
MPLSCLGGGAVSDQRRLPFGLLALAAVYLISFMHAVSSYGDPFPLLGTLYTGRGGGALAFADCLISLYLFIGILKRQRLTVWLLIAYNLFDTCNAFVNLKLLPIRDFALAAGAPVTQQALRQDTLSATIFLILLNCYVLGKRRHFTNSSPYLF